MAEDGRRSDARAERDRRLGEALRANLKRRKTGPRGDPDPGRSLHNTGEAAGRRRPARENTEES